MPDEITYFAETNYRNEKKRFGIKHADRRRHMYIIGKTGTGKTTLLDNMTIQDIQKGNGVAVLDPHGEYAERMLNFVPKERINDVVYFNPNDLEFPFGFNMLEKPKSEMRHFVASGLMGVFKKLWPDVWSARMEYFLSNSILAHLEMEDATLLGVNRIFGDKDYRKRTVSELQDPVVRGFWENEFAKLPEQFMREAVAAIQNKVGQFIANPLIRNIIGQPRSSFNLREIMDQKKILIANLSKGRIGEENSSLLGAMLVTRIYLAAMSRVDMAEDEREDFYVYVDEFQNFATESFAGILSEARKYHLNLTLANQYMAQLVDDKTKSAVLRDAIIGNVGTMISFRIGAEDAEVLEKEFSPEFMVQDFVNLGFANIYLKLMIDNVASRPFSAVTLPPIASPHEHYLKEIINTSRQRYGRAVEEIDRTIREWGGFAPSLVPLPNPNIQNGNASAAPQAPPSSTPTPVSPPPTPVSQPDDTRPKEKKKKDQKMYPAVCAIDGKPIEVPFQPDGRRPVYCSEHLSQIQRGSITSPGGNPPSPKKQEMPKNAFNAPRVNSGEVVRRAQESKPLSLKELLPKDQNQRQETRDKRQDSPSTPEKKSVDLGELRKILHESLAEKAGEAPNVSRAPNTPEVKTQNQASSGVIQPGGGVKF